MIRNFTTLAYTDAVRAVQTRFGARRLGERLESSASQRTAITDDLARFLASRDSFYFGTASAEGRPYIQHRGGKAGFLAVIDETTLAFADYPGNRQYITYGNLSENDRAFIFLIDYPNRQRIKIWGRAELVEKDAALFEKLAEKEAEKPTGNAPATPPSRAISRAIRFRVEAWDINCPKHITPRHTEDEIAKAVESYHMRIAELEREVESLRGQLANAQSGKAVNEY